MNSVQAQIDANTLTNEVKLLRAQSNFGFLLVEGDSDARLFGKFISNECHTIVCFGRKILVEALLILDRCNFEGAIGIADRDYGDYIGFPEHPDSVVFTDGNDIEITMIDSPALDSVVREFGCETRMKEVCEREGLKASDFVYRWASPLGAIRLFSHSNKLRLNFEGVGYQFRDRNNPELCFEESVKRVVRLNPEIDGYEYLDIKNGSKKILSEENSKAICRGHDCLRVIGRALRYIFGRTSDFDSDKKYSKIGNILRLAYEYEFFQMTKMYKALKDFEDRSGFLILRK